MTYFTKRYHPPGTSPGTLFQHEKLPQVPLQILLTDYTDSDYVEQVLDSPEECRTYLERDTVTWIHIQGDAEPDIIRQLGKLFGLHHLALEDVVRQFGAEHLMFGSYMPISDPNATMMQVTDARISDEDKSRIARENLYELVEGVREP